MSKSLEVRSLGYLIESGVIDAVNGFPFGKHNEDGAGVPHIRPFNVTTSGEISLAQIKYIPAEAAKGKPRLRRGDIVFNNTNTKELVGKCAVWEDDAEPVFSNHMTRIRVHDASCDAAYLCFAILHHWMIGRSEMLARAHVAQASIIGERFREIEVPWRSPAQQRAIATLLTRVRNSCQFDGKQEKAARRLKAAAMRELFTRGLRGEPQKETEIGPMPESWQIVPLSEVCIPTDQVDLDTEGSRIIQYIDVSSVSRESLAVESTNTYVLKHAPGRARKRVLAGDVIIATIRPTLKRIALIPTELDNQVCSTAFCVLRADAPPEQRKFIYYAVQRDGFIELLGRIQTGSSYPAVTDKQVKAQPIPLPSPDEQCEIVAILDAIDRKIDLHRRKKQVLEELFKALLHQLMTGEIRVTDLDLSALPAPAEATP